MMKKTYLSIFSIFLFFIGCSSTYKLTDYPSKEKFYEDFNNSALDKKLDVSLTDNSTLVVPEGAEIKNDSIYLNYYPNYYPTKLKQKNRRLPLIEVNQACYINHWKGIGPGMTSGLFIGSIIGATGLVFNYKEGGNHPETNTGASIFMGGLSGIVIGAVVGFFAGWNNIYQFNP